MLCSATCDTRRAWRRSRRRRGCGSSGVCERRCSSNERSKHDSACLCPRESPPWLTAARCAMGRAKRERALHTNEVTEDFFGAFGRSDR